MLIIEYLRSLWSADVRFILPLPRLSELLEFKVHS